MNEEYQEQSDFCFKKCSNRRKPMRLRNRSNYFCPDSSRIFVRVASPYSWQSRKAKIEGYETRLYWEFKYCQEHDGQTFFYTLTYNDKSMPHINTLSYDKDGNPDFKQQNCFDYQDLVWLLNGGFKKQLLRKYGTNFKYFVGAELGEGAGSRGLENNPHYHVIFFLRSAQSAQYPYRKITPLEFRHLVREYWQGRDEDTDGYFDYREARYGIAKEGSENLGLCTDFRAFVYCAKYVTKDVKLKKQEVAVENYLRNKYNKLYGNYPSDLLLRFYNEYLPTIPVKRNECIDSTLLNPFDDTDAYIMNIIHNCGYETDYERFVDALVEEQVRLGMNEYRNRYCNKCRVSQGLGDYGLNFIRNMDDKPTIGIPDKKKGWKNRPLCLYYYRKVFTEVVKDALGNPIRVLNQEGFDYKNRRLHKEIELLKDKTFALIDSVDVDLYSKAISSDVNVDVDMAYHDFLEVFKDKQNIISRYAIYKLVYEDRFFSYSTDGQNRAVGFPSVDVDYDFYRFSEPSYYKVDYKRFCVGDLLYSICENYISYDAHPYFLRYTRFFAVFDLLSDYLSVQTDIKNQREAEEQKRIRSFHKSQQLKLYYNKFYALCS